MEKTKRCITSLKDISFVGSGSNGPVAIRGGKSVLVSTLPIVAKSFSVDFKINKELGNSLGIGICEEMERNELYLYNGKHFWCNEEECVKTDPTVEKVLKKGEIISMYFNIEEKIVTIKRNGVPMKFVKDFQLEYKDDVTPEKWKVYVWLGGGAGEVEVTKFGIGCYGAGRKEGEIVWGDEETREERKESVRYNHSDFNVRLANKTISLPKPLLIFSNIQNLENVNEFTSLSKLSLNVDRNLIFSMLLGEYVDIDPSQLEDYYVFFRSLGLKYQLYQVCQTAEKIESFPDLYKCFREFSVTEENETINSWFSLSPSILDSVDKNSFSTALGMSLFNGMKNVENKINENAKNLTLLGVNLLQYHFKEYEQAASIEKHKDFSGCDLDSVSPLSLLKKLHGDKRLANITLRSNDNVDYKCHKEVLILRFNFFHLMFRFRGAEVQEYEETGRIRLEDVTAEMCRSLLSYAYKRDLEIKSDLDGLESVIRIICHAHQFNETDLFELCLHKLSEITKILGDSGGTGDGVNKIIGKVGLMLHINDEVREKVIPALAKLVKVSSEDYVRHLIKTTYERHEEEERVKKLEEEIERLNQLIESSGDDSIVFGGGRVRKRGNDDEKVEEENPKKRRKKE